MYEVGIGGDLIVAIDGKPVDAQDALRRELNRKRAGDTITLTILRGGRTMKIPIALGSAPQTI
jgi:S1-C subfamily serine protease